MGEGSNLVLKSLIRVVNLEVRVLLLVWHPIRLSHLNAVLHFKELY